MGNPKRAAANKSSGLSAEEKAALKERVNETRASKKQASRESDAAAVTARIDAMPPGDRVIAQRIHELVLQAAPELAPRTWYGMPAYYKDGKVVCFFQDAGKFKTRYCTFGFQDAANLDEGNLWPTSFAVVKVTDSVAREIKALVKKAVS